jgi:hypothetical protein
VRVLSRVLSWLVLSCLVLSFFLLTCLVFSTLSVVFLSLDLSCLRFTQCLPTRTQAAAVGQAHMALKEKWTVYKCMKSVLVLGTALFMMWTEDDVKLRPSTVFQGNVRIASLQGTAAGYHVFVFKDNVGRKVRTQDMDRVVTVSNNIFCKSARCTPSCKSSSYKRDIV